MEVPAWQLAPGMVIDAEPYFAEYAPDTSDYQVSLHEYHTVDYVEQETPDCVAVGMGADLYGVPSTYKFVVVSEEAS